jgi:hypothetical protein
MIKQALCTVVAAAIAGLLITAVGIAHPKQSVVSVNINAPPDQIVEVGAAVTFSASPAHGASYQWLHNGSAIYAQTNASLTIESAEIGDAGLYTCNIAADADLVPAKTVSLLVYDVTFEDDIVVYGAPLFGSGSSGTCPGAYAGYVIYTLAAPVWGWAPDTNTTVYTASDTTRTNTKVEYVGAYGDEGCNQTTVTIPHPAVSPAYRFAIYFTNNVPTTNYPITLSGLTPY